MEIPASVRTPIPGLQRYDPQWAEAASSSKRFGDSPDTPRFPLPGDPTQTPAHEPLPVAAPTDVVTENLDGAMLMMLMAQRAYSMQLRILSVNDVDQQLVAKLEPANSQASA